MNRKASTVVLTTLLSLSLFSCNQFVKGTIKFELNGGSFPNDFNVDFLQGQAGPRVQEIPDPVREGYEFVGWREKSVDGKYNAIKINLDDKTGEEYYLYPYGEVTFYAYFEPEVQIAFDLTDAKDNGGALIAPKLGTGFSLETGTLSGYTSKAIPSVDYLPTATGEHLTFEYWYTKYPLVRVADEEAGTVHYVLNGEAEEGEYRFDQAFATDEGSLFGNGMVFPEIGAGETFTLYAKWDEDPRVTVHYNLEGVEDSSFLIGVEDSLQSALSDAFEERLGIDLVSDGYKYIQDGAKRFGGLFLDADLTTPFPIDTTTPVTDDGLELYVKWCDRLHLEFDYGEGKVGQESSAETDAYYVGDILGETFLQDHSPSKENSTFSGYLLDGKRFDIVNTPLPQPKDGDTLIFVASYEDYPELTIVIDYPGTLADETVFTGYFDVGEDVSAPLRTAIDSLEDEAEFGYAGLESKPSEDADAQRETFGIRVMPSEDTTVYVMAGYKTKVEITTKWGTRTETAEKYEDVLEMPEGYQAVSYFGTVYDAKTDSYIPEVFSSEALRYDGTLKGDDGRPYLFDGIFSEASMAEGTLFHEAASDVSLQEQKVVSLYQRFTKAIAITLVYEGETCEPIYVLPNAHVSDCDALIRDALGLDEQVSYSLYLQDDGSPDDGMLVKNRLPFTDCILRVER